MFQDAQAAIPLGILLAFLPGPVFFVLLETAAVKGFRAALALDAGVIVADIVFILVVYFGTNKILERIKDDPALLIFGGMILTTYGIITLIKEKRSYARTRDLSVEMINKHSYYRLFLKGFLLNFINVGVLGFWLTILIAVGPQLNMNVERIVFFFCMVLLTYLAIDSAKIVLAKKVKRHMTQQRIYILKTIISIFIMIFGIVLLFKGFFPNRAQKIQDQLEHIQHT